MHKPAPLGFDFVVKELSANNTGFSPPSTAILCPWCIMVECCEGVPCSGRNVLPMSVQTLVYLLSNCCANEYWELFFLVYCYATIVKPSCILRCRHGALLWKYNVFEINNMRYKHIVCSFWTLHSACLPACLAWHVLRLHCSVLRVLSSCSLHTHFA